MLVAQQATQGARSESAPVVRSSTPSATRRRCTRRLSVPSSRAAVRHSRPRRPSATACNVVLPRRPNTPTRPTSRPRPVRALRGAGLPTPPRRRPGRRCRCTGTRAITGMPRTSPTSRLSHDLVRRPARLPRWRQRRGSHRTPQRQVAPPEHDERRVGDLDHRPGGGSVAYRSRRARARNRHGGDREGGTRSGAEHGRNLGPRHAAGARPGRDLGHHAVERLGRCLRHRPRASRQAELGFAAQAEDRRWSPARSATRTPEGLPGAWAHGPGPPHTPRRSTDVPDPPVADLRAMSNGGNLPPGGARGPRQEEVAGGGDGNVRRGSW